MTRPQNIYSVLLKSYQSPYALDTLATTSYTSYADALENARQLLIDQQLDHPNNYDSHSMTAMPNNFNPRQIDGYQLTDKSGMLTHTATVHTTHLA